VWEIPRPLPAPLLIGQVHKKTEGPVRENPSRSKSGPNFRGHSSLLFYGCACRNPAAPEIWRCPLIGLNGDFLHEYAKSTKCNRLLVFQVFNRFFQACRDGEKIRQFGKLYDFFHRTPNIGYRHAKVHFSYGGSDIDKGADTGRIDVLDIVQIDNKILYLFFYHL
jgi:hypothetical protein